MTVEGPIPEVIDIPEGWTKELVYKYEDIREKATAELGEWDEAIIQPTLKSIKETIDDLIGKK